MLKSTKLRWEKIDNTRWNGRGEEGGGGVLEHIPAKSWKMKANICFQIHDIGLKMNPES